MIALQQLSRGRAVVARQAHNLKIVSSNLTPATNLTGFFLTSQTAVLGLGGELKYKVVLMANNKDLIQELMSEGYLKMPSIIEAFQIIDRKDFVPLELQAEAYVNMALPIGFRQTISQPLVVAFMLELLEPKPGEQILDVGSGSGWKAALLAYVISQDENKNLGKVVSIERIPELKKIAEKNIAKYNFIKIGIVKVILGVGAKPSLKFMPLGGYDKIIAGAAGEEIPSVWKKQLKIGGRIVAPVGYSIVMLDKIKQNEFEETRYEGFSFVPLISD